MDRVYFNQSIRQNTELPLVIYITENELEALPNLGRQSAVASPMIRVQ
jgi:hypothetical protein